MADLSRVDERKKLKPQREPHWNRLEEGRYLGFRPISGGEGTWIARFYDPGTRKNTFRALGDFAHLLPNERHKAAKREAESWFDHLSAGGSRKPKTVREVCEAYAEGRKDAALRFERIVYGDAIARVPVAKLTRQQVEAWRKRMAAAPAIVSRRGKGVGRGRGKVVESRPRAASTVNRDLVPLRAALNAALDNGHVLNDQAWRVALRPIEDADGKRDVYVDREQRRALLAELPDDLRGLAHGMCLLPLRPGALAALRAGDFDARRHELTVGKDKANGARKLLVSGATEAMLREQAKGKLPLAPLFPRADGSAWNSHAWKDGFKAAAAAAMLPAEAVMYSLRHSTITDLVTAGLDLLTVAQLSGTSVRMIEKHYGHLRHERAAKALEALAL